MNRKEKKRRHYKSSTRISAANRRWKLTIDSKEASVNFYSILHAFQVSGGNGLIDAEALTYVNRWVAFITTEDRSVVARANDKHGPFRIKDTSPLSISLELDERKRRLMLFILKTMYHQLIAPEMRYKWIQNQGLTDYELAVKNYESWINSLEGEEYIPKATPKV